MAERFPHPVTPVASTGNRTVNAFWDGVDEQGNSVSGFGPVELPEYPPSPSGEALRKARVERLIGLRQLAPAAGLSPEELSALEHGKATTTPDGWAALTLALERVLRRGRG